MYFILLTSVSLLAGMAMASCGSGDPFAIAIKGSSSNFGTIVDPSDNYPYISLSADSLSTAQSFMFDGNCVLRVSGGTYDGQAAEQLVGSQGEPINIIPTGVSGYEPVTCTVDGENDLICTTQGNSFNSDLDAYGLDDAWQLSVDAANDYGGTTITLEMAWFEF